MNRKILALLTAASFALFFGACGDSDNGSSAGPEITCEDNDDCLDEDDEASSSSTKSDKKSSSSTKSDKSSSSSADEKDDDSSSSTKDDGKSSSSAKDDDKSSSSTDKDDDSSSSEKKDDSSSSEKADSSSSEEKVTSSSSSEEPTVPSSSSEEVKPVEYANTTPNLAGLEVSGDTLFAIYQRMNADWSFNHNGLLAMYKLSDGTLLGTIQLATKNPVSVKVSNGTVYVATESPYPYNSTTACGIEKINLSTKTSSLFVNGVKLGGCPSQFVVDETNNTGYVAVYISWGTVYLASVNLSTGDVMTSSDFLNVKDIAFDETTGTLFVGDFYEDAPDYENTHSGLFTYKSGISEAVSDLEEYDLRPIYSVKTINGTPYVFASDFETGKLYLNYAEYDADKGKQFYQDSKLAVVNNELYVMERDLAGSSIAKINLSTGEPTWQKNTIGKNPYDMVAASATTAWVAYYDTPILELIKTADMSSVKTIDTKAFCAVKVAAEDDK